MSTTTTVDLQAPNATTTEPRTGIFRRLIAARMREAEARARQHIARLPDQTLAELGLSPEQIATVRATGELPADFWR
jgi:hypothetical protein